MSTKNEMEAFKALLAYRDARVAGEGGDAEAQKFEDLVEDVEDFDRQIELRQMYTAINFAEADVAFEAFGKAAKQFAELKDGFELAKKMAEGGQEDLFFPSAAAELSMIASTLSALRTAAENMEDNVDALTEAFNSSDAQALIDEAEKAREELLSLLDQLDRVKDVL